MTDCESKCMTSWKAIVQIGLSAVFGALLAAAGYCGFFDNPPPNPGTTMPPDSSGNVTGAGGIIDIVMCVVQAVEASNPLVLILMGIGALVGLVIGFIIASQQCKASCASGAGGAGIATGGLASAPTTCPDAQRALADAQKELQAATQARDAQKQKVADWDHKIDIANAAKSVALAAMFACSFWNPIALVIATAAFLAAQAAVTMLTAASANDRAKLAMLDQAVAAAQNDVARAQGAVQALCPQIRPPKMGTAP
jgi:hypothetical protein